MYSRNAGDEIRIRGLKVFAHHGVYPEETRDGQNFFIDAVLTADTKKPGRTDALEDSPITVRSAILLQNGCSRIPVS